MSIANYYYQLILKLTEWNFCFRIFEMVADINSSTIFWQLLANVLIMVTVISQLHQVKFRFSIVECKNQSSFIDIQALRHIDFTTIVAFSVLFLSLFCKLLLCVSGNLITEAVANMGETVYHGNWEQYPPVYYKYVQLMILRSQTPAYFMGLKLVRCNLETLGKVRHFSVNYNYFRLK